MKRPQRLEIVEMEEVIGKAYASVVVSIQMVVLQLSDSGRGDEKGGS